MSDGGQPQVEVTRYGDRVVRVRDRSTGAEYTVGEEGWDPALYEPGVGRAVDGRGLPAAPWSPGGETEPDGSKVIVETGPDAAVDSAAPEGTQPPEEPGGTNSIEPPAVAGEEQD